MKIRATKEECVQVIDLLDDMKTHLPPSYYATIRKFLMACKSRLPSVEAVERDRKRKRAKVAS